MDKKRILVTGGCGFIGSNFIQYLLEKGDHLVVNIDKMNYSSNVKNITKRYDYERNVVIDNPHLHNYIFYQSDISDAGLVGEILEKHSIEIVYHFASQTHVDQSFLNSMLFVEDNIKATLILLECCKNYSKLKKFILVSTDEVYGEISDEKTEKKVLKHGIYNPTNPYSATKASVELICKAYHKSFKIPLVITRSNNVYGENQYWEKIVPKFVYLLNKGEKVPVYGKGEAKRKYLYVKDACEAYFLIMEKGKVGNIYEMGTNEEFTALQMATLLIKTVKPNQKVENFINFVEDRKFHDSRYIVNQKSLKELGWKPNTSFEEGLKRTIKWYINYAIPHKHWEYDDKQTLTQNPSSQKTNSKL